MVNSAYQNISNIFFQNLILTTKLHNNSFKLFFSLIFWQSNYVSIKSANQNTFHWNSAKQNIFCSNSANGTKYSISNILLGRNWAENILLAELEQTKLWDRWNSTKQTIGRSNSDKKIFFVQILPTIIFVDRKKQIEIISTLILII